MLMSMVKFREVTFRAPRTDGLPLTADRIDRRVDRRIGPRISKGSASVRKITGAV